MHIYCIYIYLYIYYTFIHIFMYIGTDIDIIYIIYIYEKMVSISTFKKIVFLFLTYVDENKLRVGFWLFKICIYKYCIFIYIQPYIMCPSA